MRIRRLFSSPTFADEEQTRRARVLHAILWSFLLIGIVPFLAALLVLPQYKARWIASEVVVIFTTPVLMLLNRRGYTRLAGVSFLTILWSLAMVMALTAGGLRSPASLGFVVVVVLIAGLLFGEKAGVISAMVLSLTGVGFVGLEAVGYLPTSWVTHTALSLWVFIVTEEESGLSQPWIKARRFILRSHLAKPKTEYDSEGYRQPSSVPISFGSVRNPKATASQKLLFPILLCWATITSNSLRVFPFG